MTALFHLLARNVVNIQPTSIVEELLPAALPVYGDGLLDAETTRRLPYVTPSAETLTDVKIKETLADAPAIKRLEGLLAEVVVGRRQKRVANRRNVRQQMEL